MPDERLIAKEIRDLREQQSTQWWNDGGFKDQPTPNTKSHSNDNSIWEDGYCPNQKKETEMMSKSHSSSGDEFLFAFIIVPILLFTVFGFTVWFLGSFVSKLF